MKNLWYCKICETTEDGPEWRENSAGGIITASVNDDPPFCCGEEMGPTSGMHLDSESVANPCVCDYSDRHEMSAAEYQAADGHFNQAGGFCCKHHGNTCGHCHQHDR